jgi:putative membrane-bound dehydrogenase-like protein
MMMSSKVHALFAGAPIAMTLLVLVRAQDHVRPSPQTFTVPAGFEVERVAGPPLVDRPIVADFDDEGRLYVADSSGSNDKVEKQLADRPHRIVRLEDTNGDGRYDTSVVFADRMMLPEGTMWLDGSLYVAAPPSIWKLTDTNGDGVADLREEWFRGETLTGCANDLHGPYSGPDGWIYWTKGAFAQQTYERTGNQSLVTRAAHIFRRRPGDSTVEVVMTGGMDNPVDVAFTASGERILSATFLEHPQAGRRDALVHAIYGGVYGKPHGVLDGHKRTGDLMPVMCQLGPAVPAGLTRYASGVFGADYRDNFFAAMFNLRKVTRHVLTPDGATFTTRDSDFLVSDNRDFHPTDVVEDADGSLLVVDTGPWYKLCCPTSQLAKPEVLGAIYRVRRKGAPRPADPRGHKFRWDAMSPSDLAKLLDDPRPSVQRRALFLFSRMGAAAVAALADVVRRSPSPEARRNAVWALTRIDGLQSREAARQGLGDRDESVRVAAAHSAGLLRDHAALPQLTGMVRSGRPAMQRAAAEALGRVGDARAVPDLIAAAASPADRVLEHSLTYALIEIGDPTSIARAGLEAAASQSRRAALIALDQMDGSQLEPERIVPMLDSPDPVLKDTAWWIAARHPEWGGAVAGFFRTRLATRDVRAAEGDDLQQKLVPFAGSVPIQQLLADAATTGAPAGTQLTALRVMAASMSSSVPSTARLKELPAVWAGALARALAIANDDLAAEVARVARAAPRGTAGFPDLRDALLRAARDRARPIEVRFAALTALGNAAPLDADLFELVRGSVSPASPTPHRAAALAVLDKARLDRDQLSALTPVLETAGPLELPRLLQVFGGDAGSTQNGRSEPTSARDEALGLAVIAALGRSNARATMRAEVLHPLLERYPESVKKAGEALLASAHVDAAKQAQRLEELLAAAQGGDVARGQTVFNSGRAACLSCHAIGYIGGRIGPDLTRIGQVRGERDLLEAIVFPSASFARGYESVIVYRRSGQALSGVLRSDAPDEVIVFDAAGTETRIPRPDVADIQPGTVSLMPPGLGEILTRQELADLLAFLRAAR